MQNENNDLYIEDIKPKLQKLLIQFQKKSPVTVYASLFARFKRDTSNLEWTRNENEWKYKQVWSSMQQLSWVDDENEDEFMHKDFDKKGMAYVFERILLLAESEMNLIRKYSYTLFNYEQSELESIQINTRQGFMVIIPTSEETFLCAIFKHKSPKGMKILEKTAKKIHKLLINVIIF